MKKRVAILLAVVLTLALAACKKPVNVNWSRTGPFEDADGNYLTIAASEDEENPGWMVWCMLGEESHGWYIQQEGEALHGNLTSEFEDAEDFIVTLTEEGEDGLQMAVEGGETYHFTPLTEMPSIHVSVDTVGLGRVYYAEVGEELVFDEESPSQVIRFNLSDAGNCQFGARADEGWQFVWSS